jgi:hypothetical protein
MNLRRFSDVAIAVAGSVLLCLVAFGTTRIPHAAISPVGEQATSHPAGGEPLTPTRVAAIEDAAAAFVALPAAADVLSVTQAEPNVVTTAQTEPNVVAATQIEPNVVAEKPEHKPEPALQLASADPADVLPSETSPPLAVAPAAAEVSVTNPAAEQTQSGLGSVEILDECFDVNACVDRYLWALYQRTPKEDTIKEPEQRRVTVKRKGKMVTVTKTFTKLVDEDFAWKDPHAAEKAGLSMMDYVIGGMDRKFKLKLFRTLYAADVAGLSPGITSAFRDDYRQSIASGLKAASNRSYHGGSLRGGYGHGLAADIVGVNGRTRDERWASSEKLWKWVDAHGKDFGIGRPYLARDPPHVGPVDGPEYASKRGAAQHAAADLKKRQRSAKAQSHAVAKRAKAAGPSKLAARAS